MNPPDKLCYTVKDATHALSISRSKLYELIASGEIPSFRWCGRRLIRADYLADAVRQASEPIRSVG
jgi:excisionase family DNA binding protein